MDNDTKEILKAGAKALENVTEAFKKLAGPLTEEAGLTFWGQSPTVPRQELGEDPNRDRTEPPSRFRSPAA